MEAGRVREFDTPDTLLKVRWRIGRAEVNSWLQDKDSAFYRMARDAGVVS